MSKIALRKLFKPAAVVAAAFSLVSLSATAQERQDPDLGIYVGASVGVGVAEWTSGSTTDRVNFSGKIFGGKRLTPGLAAEINYFQFGRLDKSNDAGRATAMGWSAISQKETAWTIGINYEVELLHNFTNHLRAGWAFTRKRQMVTNANASVTTREITYDTAPYVGAGLSFEMMRNLRLTNGIDWIVNGKDSYYLLSFGLSQEF